MLLRLRIRALAALLRVLRSLARHGLTLGFKSGFALHTLRFAGVVALTRLERARLLLLLLQLLLLCALLQLLRTLLSPLGIHGRVA
jgi:hypothetical protein